MRHAKPWYHELAAKLGHPGYVDLAEIRQAEARESREAAASVKWKHHPGGPYYAEAGDSIYVIHRNGRKWRIEAGPTALPRYTRFQDGIATLADAKNLALNMPCFRCGLGSPLILMTPCLPARPSLAADPANRWKCMNTETCEAERNRLTDRPVPVLDLTAPVDLILHNPVTGQSAPYVFDPADPSFGPVCRNSLVKNLGNRRGR